MIIDGKQLASEVEKRIAKALVDFVRTPTLAIVVVGDDPVIENFVRIKKRVGERLGIVIHEKRFEKNITGEALVRAVELFGEDASIDGVVVQLPLPMTIDTEAVLAAVPLAKDVDVLSRNAIASFAAGVSPIIPPVAGAIQEILEYAKANVAGKEALVLGHGRLVGVPASLLLRHAGAHVTVIDQAIGNLAEHVRESDIVVAGVGKPGLVTPEMLCKGSVLIDAGTSESEGKIVGDADPKCADVAGVFTPVPGGVGPLAVVMLYKNLCILARERE